MASKKASATALCVTARVLPRLSNLAESEVRYLGHQGALKRFRGGIQFWCPPSTLWRLANESRTLEQLDVRVGRAKCRSLDDLSTRIKTANWGSFLQRGGKLPRVSVACESSSALKRHEAADVRECVVSALAVRLQAKQTTVDELAKELDFDEMGWDDIGRKGAAGADVDSDGEASDDSFDDELYGDSGSDGDSDDSAGGASRSGRKKKRGRREAAQAARRKRGFTSRRQERAYTRFDEPNQELDVERTNMHPPSDAYVALAGPHAEFRVNATGARLHDRGYRRHLTGSRLRETTAAAVLHIIDDCVRQRDAASAARSRQRDAGEDTAGAASSTGARPDEEAAGVWVDNPALLPLWDPFCGSGTLLIEALDWHAQALAALPRSFSFEKFKSHDADAYKEYLADLRHRRRVRALEFAQQAAQAAHETAADGDAGDAEASEATPLFIGTDYKGANVQATIGNMEVALNSAADKGVARKLRRLVSIKRGDFDAVEPTIPPGAIVITNVPMPKRTKEGETARALYARFGDMLRRRPDLQHVYVLAKHSRFARATRLPWRTLMEIQGSNSKRRLQLLELTRAAIR